MQFYELHRILDFYILSITFNTIFRIGYWVIEVRNLAKGISRNFD